MWPALNFKFIQADFVPFRGAQSCEPRFSVSNSQFSPFVLCIAQTNCIVCELNINFGQAYVEESFRFQTQGRRSTSWARAWQIKS